MVGLRKNRLLSWILFGIIASFPPNAFPQETTEWAEVGGWDIRIDQTLDYGCFMFAGYENGTVLRLGWNPLQETAYVMIGNLDWTSIQGGKTYDVRFQFDDLAPWEVRATGRYQERLPVLVFSVEDLDFIQDVAERHNLKVYYQGEEIERLKLNDSHKALNSMVECQKTIMSFEDDQNSDPFKEDSNDPFAR